jgi:hypothetical protein
LIIGNKFCEVSHAFLQPTLDPCLPLRGGGCRA